MKNRRNKTPKSSPPPTHPSQNPPLTEPPQKPSTSQEHEQQQEPTNTNETKHKTNTRKRSQRNAKKTEKLIALEDEGKGKKYETAKPQPKSQNSKDFQNKLDRLESNIQKERKWAQKEIVANKNQCKTIKNLEKKSDMTRSHCTEINSLQIEMDQLKEETQRKLAGAETECRRRKDEAKENKN